MLLIFIGKKVWQWMSLELNYIACMLKRELDRVENDAEPCIERWG
jgi:hypothetical protein